MSLLARFSIAGAALSIALLVILLCTRVAANEDIVGSCYGARACTTNPRGPYPFVVKAPHGSKTSLAIKGPTACQSFHADTVPDLMTVQACDQADCKGKCQVLPADTAKADCFTPAMNHTVQSLCFKWGPGVELVGKRSISMAADHA